MLFFIGLAVLIGILLAVMGHAKTKKDYERLEQVLQDNENAFKRLMDILQKTKSSQIPGVAVAKVIAYYTFTVLKEGESRWIHESKYRHSSIISDMQEYEKIEPYNYRINKKFLAYS